MAQVCADAMAEFRVFCAGDNGSKKLGTSKKVYRNERGVPMWYAGFEAGDMREAFRVCTGAPNIESWPSEAFETKWRALADYLQDLCDECLSAVEGKPVRAPAVRRLGYPAPARPPCVRIGIAPTTHPFYGTGEPTQRPVGRQVGGVFRALPERQGRAAGRGHQHQGAFLAPTRLPWRCSCGSWTLQPGPHPPPPPPSSDTTPKVIISFQLRPGARRSLSLRRRAGRGGGTRPPARPPPALLPLHTAAPRRDARVPRSPGLMSSTLRAGSGSGWRRRAARAAKSSSSGGKPSSAPPPAASRHCSTACRTARGRVRASSSYSSRSPSLPQPRPRLPARPRRRPAADARARAQEVCAMSDPRACKRAGRYAAYFPEPAFDD